MLIKYLKSNFPYTIFFLDAYGASVSLTLLAVVLIPFEHLFGMPISAIFYLCLCALVLFFYSSTCFMIKPKNWRLYLLGIIFGNLIYCTLSVYFMALHWNVLKTLGTFYFVSEKIVILALISWEIKIWRSDRKT